MKFLCDPIRIAALVLLPLTILVCATPSFAQYGQTSEQARAKLQQTKEDLTTARRAESELKAQVAGLQQQLQQAEEASRAKFDAEVAAKKQAEAEQQMIIKTASAEVNEHTCCCDVSQAQRAGKPVDAASLKKHLDGLAESRQKIRQAESRLVIIRISPSRDNLQAIQISGALQRKKGNLSQASLKATFAEGDLKWKRTDLDNALAREAIEKKNLSETERKAELARLKREEDEANSRRPQPPSPDLPKLGEYNPDASWEATKQQTKYEDGARGMAGAIGLEKKNAEDNKYNTLMGQFGSGLQIVNESAKIFFQFTPEEAKLTYDCAQGVADWVNDPNLGNGISANSAAWKAAGKENDPFIKGAGRIVTFAKFGQAARDGDYWNAVKNGSKLVVENKKFNTAVSIADSAKKIYQSAGDIAALQKVSNQTDAQIQQNIEFATRKYREYSEMAEINAALSGMYGPQIHQYDAPPPATPPTPYTIQAAPLH